jgi:26S proteasome regulatory subunit N7
LDAPEILEVLHEIPHLESYINSLYHCRYAEFFVALGTLLTAQYTEAHLSLQPQSKNTLRMTVT